MKKASRFLVLGRCLVALNENKELESLAFVAPANNTSVVPVGNATSKLFHISRDAGLSQLSTKITKDETGDIL